MSPEKSTSDRHFVTWTKEEDDVLRQAVARYGEDKWSIIASQFSDKTTRQCRRRWNTYLSIDCKKGGWTPEEDRILLQAHRKFGNRWTEIAKVVPGRTDNAVKNRFCALGKKKAKKPNDLFNQNSAGQGHLAPKPGVLEQNHSITNKRTRGDDIQLMACQSFHQEQRQCNSQLKTWPSDQRMAHRAHLYTTHRTGLLSTNIRTEFSPHDKPSISTSIVHQGLGSFSDNISPPRLAALTRTAALLDSLVERRDARLKLWGNIDTDDTWRSFDRLMMEEGGMTLQSRYDQDCLSDNVKDAFYRGKENYPRPSQSSCESSMLPNAHHNDLYQKDDSKGCGSDYSAIKYNIMMDDHDADCATLENDPSCDQVDQTTPTDQYDFEIGFDAVIEDGTDPITSFLGTIPQISWDSHVSMDEIPTPEFSDIEKQFLLSAFDTNTTYQYSLYA